MADQWYYTEQRERRGPVSDEQLRQLASSGQLKPTDRVWKKGMAEWQAAAKVEGLLFPKPAEIEPPPISSEARQFGVVLAALGGFFLMLVLIVVAILATNGHGTSGDGGNDVPNSFPERVANAEPGRGEMGSSRILGTWNKSEAPYAQVEKRVREIIKTRLAPFNKVRNGARLFQRHQPTETGHVLSVEYEEPVSAALTECKKEIDALYASIPPLPMTVDSTCQQIVSDASSYPPEFGVGYNCYDIHIDFKFGAKTTLDKHKSGLIVAVCDNEGLVLTKEEVHLDTDASGGETVRGQIMLSKENALATASILRVGTKQKENAAHETHTKNWKREGATVPFTRERDQFRPKQSTGSWLTGADDLDRLQGTWNVIAVSHPSNAAKDDPTKVNIIFKGDTLMLFHKDHPGHSLTVRFVLRSSANPREIDITPPPGTEEKAVLGIYDLDGDSLTLCWGEPGSERPTAFVTQRIGALFMLKRESEFNKPSTATRETVDLSKLRGPGWSAPATSGLTK